MQSQLASKQNRIYGSSVRVSKTALRPSLALQPARNVLARGKVQKVNEAELEVIINERDRTLIVDFFATWCGPCVLMAQELEKVAEQLGDQVRVLKIDVDENPDISSALKIQGLPTVVFIPPEGGKSALRSEGLLPASQVIEIVKELTQS